MRTLQILLLGSLAGVLLQAAPSEAARKPAPARVVCGQTGCFDVPPGCRGEVRHSGRGVVAVVICPH